MDPCRPRLPRPGARGDRLPGGGIEEILLQPKRGWPSCSRTTRRTRSTTVPTRFRRSCPPTGSPCGPTDTTTTTTHRDDRRNPAGEPRFARQVRRRQLRPVRRGPRRRCRTPVRRPEVADDPGHDPGGRRSRRDEPLGLPALGAPARDCGARARVLPGSTAHGPSRPTAARRSPCPESGPLPVWQGTWDCTAIDPGSHTLTASVSTPSGSDAHTVSVEVRVTACDDGSDNDADGEVTGPKIAAATGHPTTMSPDGRRQATPGTPPLIPPTRTGRYR